MAHVWSLLEVVYPVQIATKAGALAVPEWYEAGKVSIESSGISFGKSAVVTHRPLLTSVVETNITVLKDLQHE
jgi:hypothetical protein